MRAGMLRERVTIQVASRSAGAAGGRVTTWADVRDVWARVQQDGGADREDQGQQRESKTYTVTIRRRNLSATENRLVWGGKTLAITGVADDEHREQTVITCEEGRGNVG